MECEKIEELLSAYIEGDISPVLAREVSQHLDRCPVCAALKEKIEELITGLSDLQEDVPFFLRNRLYVIAESRGQEKEEPNAYMKWMVAVLGTFVIFLNLFYFTNIYPSANRALHSVVATVKTIAVETGAFFEKVNESKDLILSGFFEKDSKTVQSDKDSKNLKKNGGKNG